MVVGADAEDGATGGPFLDGFHEDAMGGREIKVSANGGEE